MVVLSASGVTKHYGVQTVLKDISFSVEEGDKIGILGANGAGKTTLFRMITGEELPDSGEIYLSKQTKVAYMRQHSEYTSEKTAMEEVLEVFSSLREREAELSNLEKRLEQEQSDALIGRYHALQERFLAEGGMTYRARAQSALLGLGFSQEELSLPLSSISGGQRTRVLIAKLLLGEAKLLLLDEPTNHLDMKAIAWMEEFLSSYHGTVLVISHDRFFLDRVVGKIFHIENAGMGKYSGNYSYFVEQNRKEREAQRRSYEQKKREIERLEGIIAQQKQWNREKNLVTARSKQKAIDRIVADMEKPVQDPEEIRFQFHAEHGAGNDVLLLEHVEKSFDGIPLLRDVNMHVKRGERVLLIGDNGSGKTTLMRIITGQIRPDSGACELGARVKPGYFDQAQSDMLPSKSILDTVYDEISHLDLGQIRSALAAFLFKGDDVFQNVGTLSGGERARVALCRLMLSKCNFLLLDEPTNHLDIVSKEALEQALLGYDGTLLMISHDRYFINKLADKIYCVEGGTLALYPGNYEYYLAHRAQSTQAAAPKREKAPNAYQMKKERESALKKLRTRIQRAEEAVAFAEAQRNVLQAQLSDPAVSADYELVVALTEEIAKVEQELAARYEEWEAANMALEEA